MKNLFKKILCPIDFDENSIAALEAARDLAVDPDATVFVLHVVRLVLAGFPKETPPPLSTYRASRLGQTSGHRPGASRGQGAL